MRRAIPSGRENAIEKRVVMDIHTNYGIRGMKLGGPRAGTAGYNDRIFFVPGGKPVLIEFKAPGEPPRILQEHRHKELQLLGYDTSVFDDALAAIAYIEERIRRGYEEMRRQDALKGLE